MDELDEFFKNKGICVVISGMGGQGKTQLSRAYIQRIKDRSSSHIITSFPGGTYHALVTSATELAEELGIKTTTTKIQQDTATTKPLPIVDIIKEIHAKLCKTHFPWFVVIDNVDSEYDGIVEIIDKFLSLSASVLITTRRTNVLQCDTEKLKLQSLLDEDAYQLVNNELKNSDFAHVKELCTILGNHALACAQAVAYIRGKKNCSIKGNG